MKTSTIDRERLAIAVDAFREQFNRARSVGLLDFPSIPSIISKKAGTLLSVNRTRYAEKS